MHGCVDLGIVVNDDRFPVAIDAFGLMLVAINGRWKPPIGYFLVDGLDSEQRSNLVL